MSKLIYKINYNFEAIIGNKKIRFKQWTAKEERKYLENIEKDKNSIDDNMIYETLIKPCIEDKDLILSTQEQKLLLIKIREESIGKTFKDEVECRFCKTKSKETIELSKIYKFRESRFEEVLIEFNNEIFKFNLGEISDNKLKENLNLKKGILNYIYNDFIVHIKSIEYNNEKYKVGDNLSISELMEFMDSLPNKVFDELFEKYNKMVDKLDLTYKFKCKKCNKKNKIKYNNIPGFLWI